MGNDMTVTEEVYRYLQEHPEMNRITSTVLHGQMNWLKKDNISCALYKFYKEDRLELIDLEIGERGQKLSVYVLTDAFNNPPRKFKRKHKDRPKGWRKRSTGSYDVDTRRKKLIGSKRGCLLQRLDALSAVVLEVSIEIEAIKKEI